MEDNPQQTIVSKPEVQIVSAEIKTNVDFGNDQQVEPAGSIASNMTAPEPEAKSTPPAAIDNAETTKETENTDLTAIVLDESQYVHEHTLVSTYFLYVCRSHDSSENNPRVIFFHNSCNELFGM